MATITLKRDTVAIQNSLEIQQGTTFSQVFNLKNINSVSTNIVGNVFESKIRKSYGSNTATSLVGAIVDGANGQFKVTLANSNTAAITSGRYVYDVNMTNNFVSPATVDRIVSGIITISPQSTR